MAKQLVDELKDGVKKRLETEKEKIHETVANLSPSEIANDVRQIVGQHEVTAEEMGTAIAAAAAFRADGRIEQSELEIMEDLARKEKEN